MIQIITIIALVVGLLVSICTLCTMLYAFRNFLAKPRTTLENEVVELKVQVKEIKQSLLKGNDRFRGQEDINEVVLHSLIALIEFEIEYCLTEHKVPSDGLKKAKEDLHLFLAGKRG